jgi:hypothetical protein
MSGAHAPAILYVVLVSFESLRWRIVNSCCCCYLGTSLVRASSVFITLYTTPLSVMCSMANPLHLPSSPCSQSVRVIVVKLVVTVVRACAEPIVCSSYTRVLNLLCAFWITHTPTQPTDCCCRFSYTLNSTRLTLQAFSSFLLAPRRIHNTTPTMHTLVLFFTVSTGTDRSHRPGRTYVNGPALQSFVFNQFFPSPFLPYYISPPASPPSPFVSVHLGSVRPNRPPFLPALTVYHVKHCGRVRRACTMYHQLVPTYLELRGVSE